MSAGRVVLTASILVVVASVIAGLLITGSPSRQRELRLDKRRIDDVRSLSNALSRHYLETGQLPEEIDEVVDGRIMSRLPRDPVSGDGYDYTRTSTAAYRICGEFARAVETGAAEDFWAHAAGRQCFEFDYSELEPD